MNGLWDTANREGAVVLPEKEVRGEKEGEEVTSSEEKLSRDLSCRGAPRWGGFDQLLFVALPPLLTSSPSPFLQLSHCCGRTCHRASSSGPRSSRLAVDPASNHRTPRRCRRCSGSSSRAGRPACHAGSGQWHSRAPSDPTELVLLVLWLPPVPGLTHIVTKCAQFLYKSYLHSSSGKNISILYVTLEQHSTACRFTRSQWKVSLNKHIKGPEAELKDSSEQ